MAKKKAESSEIRPWCRRQWPMSGDKNQEALYAAVGRALSEWERYEAALAFLFANFVGGAFLLPAKRAYGAVRTFEGRCDMLRAASEAYFYGTPDDELLRRFKSILSNAVSFSQRRNDIAHGVVDHYQPEPPTERIIPAPEEYALFPAYATFKERDPESAPAYCYTSMELEYFRQEFFELREPAMSLCREIAVSTSGAALRGKLRSLYRE